MQLQTRLRRRPLLMAGAAALAGLGAAAVWRLRRPAPPPGPLAVAAHTGDLPADDPGHSAWQAAPAHTLAVVPQQMVYPMLREPAITAVTLRALWNGTQLGVHLEWQDDGADDLESITRFRDAAAVMIPFHAAAETAPPIFMGIGGQPVYILQWKASWQRDIDQGFQGVEQSYPRWFNDVYPGHETLTELGLDAQAAEAFYPALAAGNILSRQQRASAVEELAAEGFGTLTTLPQQRARGRGAFSGGRWQVSIGVPAGGPDTPALASGQTISVAFAVWNGGRRNAGGRKHYADWSQLALPGG